jgi:hypothetical protein
MLGKNYFPVQKLKLSRISGATIRGEVIDGHEKRIADADVVLPQC